MSNLLFDEFETVSTKQWKQKIQFDLKGADYNNLVWNSNEGIQVKPFYNSDDLNKTLPSIQPKSTAFKLCETIFVANAVISNQKAKEILNQGIEALKFIIPSEGIEINTLLKDIDFTKIPLYFKLQFLSETYISKIIAITKKAKIYIDFDVIGHLAKTGNWYNDLKNDFSQFNTIFKLTNSISINVSLYQNAGANMVQQLAYALAHANEYLNNIKDLDLSKLYITFNVSVGSNYFFEIAKLRALRVLYNTLSIEYKASCNCHIYVTPSKRNKAIYDYNTNMLRTTTECMSAILGGADTINNLPYDAIFNKDNDFGSRIARNQLLILKHESYFNLVNNASDGSYYIESLTKQLAEKAIQLFKNIEANGGFLKQLKAGTIQRKITESAIREQEQFNNTTEIILGSNKHPNLNDKMKTNLELYPFIKTNKRKTLIQPIIEKRLTETLEQERLNKE